jgi:hypothetical protein
MEQPFGWLFHKEGVMFRMSCNPGKWILYLTLAMAVLSPIDKTCAGSSETVLYSFQDGSDGANPYAG